MKTAQEWFDQANALYESGKFQEADKCLDEVLALDNKFMQAYRWKFKLFYSLGKYQDMIHWCDKAIEVDPNYFFAYNSKGNALRELGKPTLALESFSKAISIDPNHAFAHNGKANALGDLGRREEAIECYNKALEINPNDEAAYNGKAGTLWELGRLEEAKKAYDKSIEKNPKSTLSLCNRGKILSRLGRHEEALADFKKIKTLYQSGYVDVSLNAGNQAFVNETLKSIVELDDVSAETEAVIKKADQSNPTVQKFMKSVKQLQENKNKITASLIANMDKNNASETSQLMQELQQLKKEFAEMQKDIVNVKKDIKKLDDQMHDVREELDNKLDDFHKKLGKELKKLDLSPEDQEKLKEYFKAFIETFSSLHVTAQVVDSGQVQIDAESTKTTILSTIASFAPFIGGVLSGGIKTVGEFLASKEIKTNAKKMKGLASDSSALSQLIGKSAYEVVLNKDKQEQILKVTIEDLKPTSNSLFQKIKQICDNIGEELDAYLYTKLHKTPAARLGHNDANDLIGEWLNDSIDVFNIEGEFVKKATSPKNEGPKEMQSPTRQAPNANRSACCNVF